MTLLASRTHLELADNRKTSSSYSMKRLAGRTGVEAEEAAERTRKRERVTWWRLRAGI